MESEVGEIKKWREKGRENKREFKLPFAFWNKSINERNFEKLQSNSQRW